jgi:hypothetical protein
VEILSDKSGEDKAPIEQAPGYLKRIRQGKVTTAHGRPIPNSEDTPGYCYVVCGLTTTMVERCKFWDLTTTRDYLGYFGFHKQFKAYIEVISYDKMVDNAKRTE